jgi:hypothetical protein
MFSPQMAHVPDLSARGKRRSRSGSPTLPFLTRAVDQVARQGAEIQAL